MSTVGYFPKIKRMCKFCNQVEIFIGQEVIHTGMTKWVARNSVTGEIHSCVTDIKHRIGL